MIESSVYGSNSVSKILKGKTYIRSVRAHKILFEALTRLRWDSFIDWLVSQDNVEFDTREINQLLVACQNLDGENFQQCIFRLSQLLDPVVDQLKCYRNQQSELSATFVYWEQYIGMVEILLCYIRAEREGDWNLHLESVAQMIPYFFAYDHLNYARWASVYLIDMKLLSNSAPLIEEEFLNGNHTVCRSTGGTFNGIWTDLASEQSVNRDTKTHGGIVSFSMNPSALVRWFLTAHEWAAITGAFKEMSGCGQSEKQPMHKEFGKIRKKRDEEDVQKVTKLLLTIAKNPFEVAERLNEETGIEGQEIPTSGHGNHDAGQENSEIGQADETADQSESEEE